jgi:hypothetical protein
MKAVCHYCKDKKLVDALQPDDESQNEPDSQKPNTQFRTSFTGNNEWYTPA